MGAFTVGQEVLHNGEKFTVTKVTEPQTETTYELTPVVTVIALEDIPESEITGE